MLQLHLPRHQQGAYLHVRRGLLLTDFFNRGRPVLFEIGSEREQKISIERPTRSFQGPARVSRPPRSEFAVDALGDVVRIGLGIQGHRGILCLLRAWRITDRGRFSQQEQTISSLFRSEEHTSELQSLRHLVCRLLLEKKKKIKL